MPFLKYHIIHIHILTDFRQYGQMEKQRWEELEKGRAEERRSKKQERVRRKKMQSCEKAEKSRFTVFIQWFGGFGGSKSKLAKAAGAEPCGQMRDENCTPLWREAHFEVKMCKAQQVRTTFGRWAVEKVHAVVARSTFQVKSAKNWRPDVVLRGRRTGFCTLSKVSKTWGFCGSFNYDHYTTLHFTTLHYTTKD